MVGMSTRHPSGRRNLPAHRRAVSAECWHVARYQGEHLYIDAQGASSGAINAQQALDAAEPMASAIWMYEDVTDRRLAEQALRQAKGNGGERQLRKSGIPWQRVARAARRCMRSSASPSRARAAARLAEKSQPLFLNVSTRAANVCWRSLNDLLDRPLEAARCFYNMKAAGSAAVCTRGR